MTESRGRARRPRDIEPPERGARSRGSIDQLPSGKFRVRIHAGQDPLTGGRHTLVEVVDTKRDAEKMRTKLLAQVDERRNPRTKATVDKLLQRYLEVLDVEPSTRKTYEGYINNHIRPAVGSLQVGALDGEILDRFYAQLRRCRRRCRGKQALVDHRTARAHTCDARCAAHECKPMQAATVRQIHFILSGALHRAVRWRWITTSPVDAAQPPSAPPPNPRPPSPEDAAAVLQAAWDEDPSWGTFVWMAMVTGARRGELLAIRRPYVDLDRSLLTLPRSVSEQRQEKDTKTHQQRRIALDADTVDVLRDHFERLDATARSVDAGPSADAFVFSHSPTGDVPMSPRSLLNKARIEGLGGEEGAQGRLAAVTSPCGADRARPPRRVERAPGAREGSRGRCWCWVLAARSGAMPGPSGLRRAAGPGPGAGAG